MAGLKLFFVYWLSLVVIALIGTGCSSPAKVFNLITPDRVGYGILDGSMTGLGVGNKTMRNQEQPLELDFHGDSEASMIWLEWDFPQWEDSSQKRRDLRNRAKAFAKAVEREAYLLHKDEMENMIIDKWLEEKSNAQEE